jgi:tRNA-2-methylthio-N6-dimethylallyladenosine synthase
MTNSTPQASTGPKKRLFVRSWGCQMNVYDSGRMADVLAPLGYAPVNAPEGADMIILNTCHIREKATDKLFSELGRLRIMKEQKAAEGGEMVLAVAGCVAQAEGREIVLRAPYVDIVLGPQSYHKLPEMVARAGRAAGAVIETDFPVEEKFDHLPDASAPQGVTAFLTIQEGCDKFCSFCVVPYTRGAEYSRSATAVLAEARRMVAQGTREISLLGQNVNAYHGVAPEGARHGSAPDGSEWGLARLLYALAEIPGLERLRYTTSHPRDMDDALIAAHRDLPAVMPFLHLPVQSGSDRMLEAMNRGHTAEDYLRLVDRLREARPDMAFSTDIISGHPGEKEEDHEATMELIRRVGFAQSFSFKYSARPGTPAAGAPYRVDEATKDRRLQEVQALLRDQQAGFNASKAGQTVPVLFTGAGRQPGQLSGRTPWLQPVHVAGDLSLVGRVAPVSILAGLPYSLHGEVLHALQSEKNAA